MKTVGIRAVIKVLNESLHSHGIFAASALADLEPHVTIDTEASKLTDTDTGASVQAPFYTKNEMTHIVRNSRNGGNVNADAADILFSGYEAAQSLALLAGCSPKRWNHLIGKGFIHQACVGALKEKLTEMEDKEEASA